MSFTIRAALVDHRADGDDCEGLAMDDDAAFSEAAAQKITALGEMTGGIAHDFRNILAIIGAGLRLAERFPDDPEKVRTCLAAAHDGVSRGLKLTSRLLDFAKRHDLEPQAADANDLLRNLEIFLKYGAGPGIRIAFDLAADIPKCLIDPSQFNAAILNLVVNARDAMPHGGEVRISTMACEVDTAACDTPAPGRYVRVRVRDSGRGMSADVARKIFDPYFTTKVETGTGLGLPQVHAFMQSLGGHVGVTSELGHGTSFDLLFPAQHSRSGGADTLWRQVDRWLNEGGAEGDEMSSSIQRGMSENRKEGQSHARDPAGINPPRKSASARETPDKSHARQRL